VVLAGLTTVVIAELNRPEIVKPRNDRRTGGIRTNGGNDAVYLAVRSASAGSDGTAGAVSRS
jgi:hypothetical protein